MRNFANYDVDIHGKSSGVLKTICKNVFLPARISATVRYVSTSTRATVTVIIVALIFMFPMMWKRRKNAERCGSPQASCSSHSAAFSASSV